MASKKDYDRWGEPCIKVTSKRKSTRGTVKKSGSKKGKK